MSLYQLNLGNIQASSYRQYKTIKLKKKIAKIFLWLSAIIWLSVIIFLLTLIVKDELFFVLAIGVFALNIIAIISLYGGILDVLIFRLSRKLYQEDE